MVCFLGHSLKNPIFLSFSWAFRGFEKNEVTTKGLQIQVKEGEIRLKNH